MTLNVAQIIRSSCGIMCVEQPRPEYVFAPPRKFRFDFAWRQRKIAIEVDGGIYARRPSHHSLRGILRDMEKQNLATMLGWRVLRYTPQQIEAGHWRNDFLALSQNYYSNGADARDCGGLMPEE